MFTIGLVYGTYMPIMNMNYRENTIATLDGVDKTICERTCDSNSKCVAYVLEGNSCTTKSQLGVAIPNNGVSTYVKEPVSTQNQPMQQNNMMNINSATAIAIANNTQQQFAQINNPNAVGDINNVNQGSLNANDENLGTTIKNQIRAKMNQTVPDTINQPRKYPMPPTGIYSETNTRSSSFFDLKKPGNYIALLITIIFIAILIVWACIYRRRKKLTKDIEKTDSGISYSPQYSRNCSTVLDSQLYLSKITLDSEQAFNSSSVNYSVTSSSIPPPESNKYQFV